MTTHSVAATQRAKGPELVKQSGQEILNQGAEMVDAIDGLFAPLNAAMDAALRGRGRGLVRS